LVSSKCLSISLCLVLVAAPLHPALADTQTAGEVKALIPSATRNAQPVKAKDSLAWNDLLKTGDQGRLRAGLTAGSILSLGSNSELQVVQHDAVSQQTSLVMDYGKLRNQVAKITKPGGKYEVRTPNAVIGVTGTDFYVGYENNLTTVICYEGTVAVTPSSGAKVVKKDDKSKRTDGVVMLWGGQMVVIGLDAPAGGYLATATPAAVAETSIQDTNVPDQPVTVAHHHTLRKGLLLLGPAAGVGVAVGVLTNTGGGGSTSTTTPPPPPPATTTIDFTNQFGTINLTDAGLGSKGSELQSYNGIAAPPKRSLGSVNFSAGAFSGTSILTGGTFSNAGSSFNLISGPANFGQPPKGNIFTGSFAGPVTWTLVSQTGKYKDNFTLSGTITGTLAGSTVTGTAKENVTLYTNQWAQDHEVLIRTGSGQLIVPDPSKAALLATRMGLASTQLGLRGTRMGLAGMRMGPPDAQLNALARKSARRKFFGWSFVF
jgi:hypothetical protein